MLPPTRQSLSGFIIAPKFQPLSFIKAEKLSFTEAADQLLIEANIDAISVSCIGVSSFQRFFTVCASYVVGVSKKKLPCNHKSETNSQRSFTSATTFSILTISA